MAESTLTKRAIANSLKELARVKPFDKISVGDISKQCSINRQTFYYHFQDKYDLITWIYYEDYFKPYMEGISFDNWDVCIRNILTAVKEDRAFSVNTIKHAQTELVQVFMNDTIRILDSAMDSLREKTEAGGATLGRIDQEEQQFIARFFAYGLSGTIIAWAEAGMKEDPAVIARRLRSMLETSKQLAYNRVLEEAAGKIPPISYDKLR